MVDIHPNVTIITLNVSALHVPVKRQRLPEWIKRLDPTACWPQETHFKFCCSVAKSCPTLCDPMNCSTPASPVFHSRPLSMWCHPTFSSSTTPFSSFLQSFPGSGYFPVSWLFISSHQSIGASASASVLPMNIQGWFPLELSGLISLLSKGLSRVFFRTTVWKHQF